MNVLHFLEEKHGPLPGWGWLGVGAVAAFVLKRMKGTSSATQPQTAPFDLGTSAQPQPVYSGFGGGGGGFGSGGGSTGTGPPSPPIIPNLPNVDPGQPIKIPDPTYPPVATGPPPGSGPVAADGTYLLPGANSGGGQAAWQAATDRLNAEAAQINKPPPITYVPQLPAPTALKYFQPTPAPQGSSFSPIGINRGMFGQPAYYTNNANGLNYAPWQNPQGGWGPPPTGPSQPYVPPTYIPGQTVRGTLGNPGRYVDQPGGGQIWEPY